MRYGCTLVTAQKPDRPRRLLALLLVLGTALPAGLLAASPPASADPAVPASEPEQPSAPRSIGDMLPLTVIGQTVVWNTTPGAASYKVAISNLARGASGRATRYLSIAGAAGEVQLYTPAVAPGETAYVGVSADGGLTWSGQEAIVTAPPSQPEQTAEAEESEAEESEAEQTEAKAAEAELSPDPNSAIATPAPILRTYGRTLRWKAVAHATSYELATILDPTASRKTANTSLPVIKKFKPPVVPGQTVDYALAVNVNGVQGPWSSEVSITYPETVPRGGSESAGGESGGGESPSPPVPPVEIEAPISPPLGSGKIIGTNDGAGWGAAPAKTILAGHITWDRVEVGAPSPTPAMSLSDGFHVLGIVGNIADSTPLSRSQPAAWGAEVVAQLRANPGISIAEAGNEMYYKGKIAEPVQYGRMYLAAVNAMKAAGIHTPLLFNMFGDYPLGGWSSPSGKSEDARGGGWLRDAVAGVPGLAEAILANGLSTHPYGALNENDDDVNGVKAVIAQEAVAQSVLGAIPPLYITEFGYNLNACGKLTGACSQQEQATEMRAAYAAFLADPHVAGIWWYQSHDDSIGQFGFMNNDNSTRPSFATLSSIAIEQGQ